MLEEQKKEELKQENPDAPKDSETELKEEETPKAPEGEIKDDKTSDDYYQKELQKLKEERENYKQGMLDAKEKLKNKEDYEFDEDKLNELVEKKIEGLRGDINQSSVENVLLSLSDNPDERALIMEHYNNSIQKTGSSAENIKKDLINARLIANKDKIFSENSELKAALGARYSVSSGVVGSNSDKPKDTQDVKLTSMERSLFDRTNQRRVQRGAKPLTEQEFVGQK